MATMCPSEELTGHARFANEFHSPKVNGGRFDPYTSFLQRNQGVHRVDKVRGAVAVG